MATQLESDSKRPIRSYVIRAGRLTVSQRRAIDLYWQRYVIDYAAEPLQLDSVFSTNTKLIVEIGFGMGDSLLHMARQDPASNFIGIDVHRPGVGKLLQGIAAHELGNLKIICHDAKEVMQHCFCAQSIDRLLILFPDPWPKKRHHKRRLVQSDFIALITKKLKAGAEVHLATDWQAYAEQMMEVMEATDELTNQMGSAQYWQEPHRPQTKFERRGMRLGHGVWDLLFSKVG
ncbi:MAG: tRNA (guanosine(46)-N7)-methyltransferase TrmB [Proteobacteria bacterium]|nr:tRNA (guanosine(46)-N7)-methyltransferase TrmB [Pseudomonadota bacterium]